MIGIAGWRFQCRLAMDEWDCRLPISLPIADFIADCQFHCRLPIAD
jgi:hypothetical protein